MSDTIEDQDDDYDGSTPDFDEAAYLAAFPKVAENVRSGNLKSAHEHYLRHGAVEKRLQMPRYRKALAEQALLARLSAPSSPDTAPEQPTPSPSPSASAPASAAPRPYTPSGLDIVLVASGGTCVAIGWVDDRGAPLAAVSLRLPDGRTTPTLAIARCRRADAEAAIGCPPGTLLGFYAIIEVKQPEPPGPGTTVQLHCGGEPISHPVRIKLFTPPALRDSVFEYLAAATYFGSPPVESFLQLQAGIGEPLLAFNRRISAAITGRAHVERHGNHAGPFCASVVVCLYGRIEYLFLQAALFSTAPGAAEYEYVYVSNSPELTEQLQREARLAARMYGLAITLVILPGNAGFGAANNAAVRAAASARILIVNPDVFPCAPDWAHAHRALVESLPAEQTALFGVPLFYDDGALMHGGMFFETDSGLSVTAEGTTTQDLLRVEHYGKGAPPDFQAFRAGRPVPAVTGAFMSTDRAWFERLGGFSEDYVFGHYEDADLCLRAWQEGGQVWLHDLPFWHMEGKGSTRVAAHEGGSAINRWHFTRLWLPTVQDGFAGPNPARLGSARPAPRGRRS